MLGSCRGDLSPFLVGIHVLLLLLLLFCSALNINLGLGFPRLWWVLPFSFIFFSWLFVLNCLFGIYYLIIIYIYIYIYIYIFMYCDCLYLVHFCLVHWNCSHSNPSLVWPTFTSNLTPLLCPPTSQLFSGEGSIGCNTGVTIQLSPFFDHIFVYSHQI
jgi:hypothetical protein